MMSLDLNQLAVESFPTVEGDPAQWLMRLPPPTNETDDDCCSDDLAGASVNTWPRHCGTTTTTL